MEHNMILSQSFLDELKKLADDGETFYLWETGEIEVDESDLTEVSNFHQEIKKLMEREIKDGYTLGYLTKTLHDHYMGTSDDSLLAKSLYDDVSWWKNVTIV